MWGVGGLSPDTRARCSGRRRTPPGRCLLGRTRSSNQQTQGRLPEPLLLPLLRFSWWPRWLSYSSFLLRSSSHSSCFSQPILILIDLEVGQNCIQDLRGLIEIFLCWLLMFVPVWRTKQRQSAKKTSLSSAMTQTSSLPALDWTLQMYSVSILRWAAPQYLTTTHESLVKIQHSNQIKFCINKSKYFNSKQWANPLAWYYGSVFCFYLMTSPDW